MAVKEEKGVAVGWGELEASATEEVGEKNVLPEELGGIVAVPSVAEEEGEEACVELPLSDGNVLELEMGECVAEGAAEELPRGCEGVAMTLAEPPCPAILAVCAGEFEAKKLLLVESLVAGLFEALSPLLNEARALREALNEAGAL